MPLIIRNESLLQKGGSLASDLACCCSANGACCDGTTCTIKSQAACTCSPGVCCGPDTVTIRGGTETYSRYRLESRQACRDRGGTWRCGSFGPLSVEGYSGPSLCPNNAGTPEPVFQGVGTTCSPNPCNPLP